MKTLATAFQRLSDSWMSMAWTISQDWFAIEGRPAQGVKDEDWIPAIGSSHLVISLDMKLLRRPRQRRLLMEHEVSVSSVITSAHLLPERCSLSSFAAFHGLNSWTLTRRVPSRSECLSARPIRPGSVLSARSAITLPLMLSPYRVIDFTDERGVLAGQMLADLGADVIQVEPPTGSTGRNVAPFFADHPDESIYWAAYTRGKRGITCNPADPRGRDLLLRLLETADFLIESADVGTMSELGLDYESLHQRFPATHLHIDQRLRPDRTESALRRLRPCHLGRRHAAPDERRRRSGARANLPATGLGPRVRRRRRRIDARPSCPPPDRTRTARRHLGAGVGGSGDAGAGVGSIS